MSTAVQSNAFAANDRIVVADVSTISTSLEYYHLIQNAKHFPYCQPMFHSMNARNDRLNVTHASENGNRLKCDGIDGVDDDDDAVIVAIVLADFGQKQYPKINLNFLWNLESIVVDGVFVADAVAAADYADAADAGVSMAKGQMKKLN